MVTLRNANFGTLRMRISVSYMLHVRGVRKLRMWPYYCRERRVEHKEVLNGKKIMHADTMDGSISTEHEDSDQRRRRLATFASP